MVYDVINVSEKIYFMKKNFFFAIHMCFNRDYNELHLILQVTFKLVFITNSVKKKQHFSPKQTSLYKINPLIAKKFGWYRFVRYNRSIFIVFEAKYPFVEINKALSLFITVMDF